MKPASAGDHLRLQLAVRGTLRAQGSGQSIGFADTAGTTVLTYGGLKAWDATGRALPAQMHGEGDRVHIEVAAQDAQYPVTIDPIAQMAYLKASNTEANDWFGNSVAVSGDIVVVGAPGESSSATGINGDQTDNNAYASGAAYVFVRSGSTWSQQAYLKASNTGWGDQFGMSVAVSGDTVVVSARDESSNATGVNGNQTDNSASLAGAAYVFVRSGSTWSQQAYLKASNTESNDQFGISVAVSGDTVVVGAVGEASSAKGINGNQADNSAGNAGAAYVFVRSGSTWKQQAYLKASNTDEWDYFGNSVAVSGDTVVVSAVWESSNATSIDGDQTDNNAYVSGAAYVFVRNGSTWRQQTYLKASNTDEWDLFGISVAISGDTVVVGTNQESSNATGVNGDQTNDNAHASGAAYVFVRSGSTWSQQAYLKASNTQASDGFGSSVAVSGDTVVVGASGESSNATGINGNQADNSASGAGAAYVFKRSGSTWQQQAYLKASNTQADDDFGLSVAVSGDTVVVGAYGESSNATGINGNQADNSASDAGATYLFNIGKTLTSLAKSGTSAAGAADITYLAPGQPAIAPSGAVFYTSTLRGTGAPRGRNSAIFANTAADLDYLSMQNGSLVSGVVGLPLGAKITSLGNPISNTTITHGLYLAKVKGTAISSTNNTLLLHDNGSFVSPVARTGQAVTALSGAQPSAYRAVLQHSAGVDEIDLLTTLKTGVASTTAINDSALLRLAHDGTEIAAVREGEPAYGGGGNFGQITFITTADDHTFFICPFLPTTSGLPSAALFHTGLDDGRNIAMTQRSTAGGSLSWEKFSTFTGLTHQGSKGLVRATLSRSAASKNEGVWLDDNTLLLRKGDTIPGGAVIARILRVWGTSGDQALAHVTLTGREVTLRNNQALILVQNDLTLYTLLRSGDPATATGIAKATIGVIQAVDLNHNNGHYAVLTSVSGTAASANQALWTGQTTLGDDSTLQYQRLPRLRMRKGERYTTEATPRDTVLGLAIKPAADASGVGSRGLAQIISSSGDLLVEITGNHNIKELVRLTP